jgi:hypothetical protein
MTWQKSYKGLVTLNLSIRAGDQEDALCIKGTQA